MSKGKFTDHIRPIVILMLTVGFIYGFIVLKEIKGEQYTIVFMAVISFLFGESVGKKLETMRSKEE